MMQTTIKTDVSSELITTAQAKQYIKQTYTAGADATLTAEDALIDVIVKAARLAAEHYTNRTFAQKTLITWWDTLWDEREFALPRGPHQSIVKVESLDAEETATELTVNTDYFKRGTSDYILTVNRIVSSPIIPVFKGKAISQLKVEYVAGYTSVPSDVYDAMYDIIAYLYKNRGVVDMNSMNIIPANAKTLLTPYRQLAI